MIFQSENESSGMIEVLRELQRKYVPQTTVVNAEEIGVEDVLLKIPFGGDQLTEERAINVQKALNLNHV